MSRPTKAELFDRAKNLGFALVRVSAPKLPVHHREAYARWLDAGMNAGMAWMTRGHHLKREAVDFMASARSVVVLGLPYYRETKVENAQGPAGRVALYATGLDYHEAMEQRLGELASWLESFGGEHRWTVDYRPLFERAYAAQAGLGFIGKNTCLIHPQFGSYLFLGTVVSSFDWEPDAPLPDDCGSCRRCLDACPTGALVEPYMLDARRCLNYWTIEHKGELPEEIQAKLGNRLYGCDTCQEVCPFNRDLPETDIPEFATERVPARFPLDLADVIPDEPTFKALFKGTVFERLGWERFQRNLEAIKNR